MFVVISIVFLHLILFSGDKKILILANKFESSKELLNKIKDIYKLLPFFLKTGAVNWNEKQIAFENNSRIQTQCISKKPQIVVNYNVLYIDQISSMPKNIIMPFYEAMLQTLNDIGSKIIINSVPNGFNYFYDMVVNSERFEGDPKKNAYKTMRVYWWQVPGRDQKWKEEQIKILGSEEAFDQEFDLQFKTKKSID